MHIMQEAPSGSWQLLARGEEKAERMSQKLPPAHICAQLHGVCIQDEPWHQPSAFVVAQSNRVGQAGPSAAATAGPSAGAEGTCQVGQQHSAVIKVGQKELQQQRQRVSRAQDVAAQDAMTEEDQDAATMLINLGARFPPI